MIFLTIILFRCIINKNKKDLQGGHSMIIQSKKVWIADQFIPAQVEMENGKIIRDLGGIVPERDVRFEFGPAMDIEGNGQAQQLAVEDFIAAAFERWQQEEK
jgi:hypothetical protein